MLIILSRPLTSQSIFKPSNFSKNVSKTFKKKVQIKFILCIWLCSFVSFTVETFALLDVIQGTPGLSDP